MCLLKEAHSVNILTVSFHYLSFFFHPCFNYLGYLSSPQGLTAISSSSRRFLLSSRRRLENVWVFVARMGRRSRADSWIRSWCLTEMTSLCRWKRTLWLQNASGRHYGLHTRRCIDTQGHGSSKHTHTHTALGSEHSLLCISRLFFHPLGQRFPLKKKKKKSKLSKSAI